MPSSGHKTPNCDGTLDLCHSSLACWLLLNQNLTWTSLPVFFQSRFKVCQQKTGDLPGSNFKPTVGAVHSTPVTWHEQPTTSTCTWFWPFKCELAPIKCHLTPHQLCVHIVWSQFQVTPDGLHPVTLPKGLPSTFYTTRCLQSNAFDSWPPEAVSVTRQLYTIANQAHAKATSAGLLVQVKPAQGLPHRADLLTTGSHPPVNTKLFRTLHTNLSCKEEHCSS